jgi:hypothetical protein
MEGTITSALRGLALPAYRVLSPRLTTESRGPSWNRLDMRFVKIIHAPGLVEGSSEVQDDAPFALIR